MALEEFDLTYAEKAIHEIDPTVNPMGVEEFMRAEHGTLNHLGHAEFAAAVRVAKDCEAEMPGCLRRWMAGGPEAFERFDAIQAAIA